MQREDSNPEMMVTSSRKLMPNVAVRKNILIIIAHENWKSRFDTHKQLGFASSIITSEKRVIEPSSYKRKVWWSLVATSPTIYRRFITSYDTILQCN